MNDKQKKQLDDLVKLTILEAIADDLCISDLDAEWNEALSYLQGKLETGKDLQLVTNFRGLPS